MVLIDITGKKFNRLTVVEISHRHNSEIYWKCKCDCGTFTTVSSKGIRYGKTKSCGCFHREQVSKRTTTHGMTGTQEYIAWYNIKARCYNKNHVSYANYGGRGIVICDRWLESFQNFFDDMGLKPSKAYTIERLDNSEPYSPENCKWATYTEQANNKRNNHLVTIGNETKTTGQWAKVFNISPVTICSRVNRKWTLFDSITTPGDKRYWHTSKSTE